MSSFIPAVQGNLLAGLLAVLALCGAVLSGCLPVKRAEAMMIDSDMKHIAVAAPTSIAVPTPPATATAKPLTEDTPTPSASSSESAASPPAPPSLLSLEQIIEKSHIVARVRLSSTATRVESIETDYKQVKDGRFFGLFMDFEFEVLEYLKGSGNSRIWGSVSAGGGFDTRKDALAAAVEYWKVRDKYIYSRWDDREAIVLLYDVSSSSADMHVALSRQSDTYRLGAMRIVGNEFVEGYSVASPYFKAWLPSALPGSGASGVSGGERQFLLDAPGGYAVGGRGPSKGASGPSEAYAPKISLSSFKAKIAEAIGTPTPTATATPSTTQTPTPLAPSSASTGSPSYPPYPLPSLEQMIEKSHIVARVRLSSTASRVERIETGHKHLNGGRFFALFMDFEFEVLEYLKGSGNSRIWGSVMAGGGFDTPEDALAAAVDYWKIRDKYIYSRWDDREAIVMLYDVSSLTANLDKGLVRQSDTYLLGRMVVGNGFWESYSVASPYFKAWLPSALPGSGASGASGGERQFLLDAPGGYAVGGRGPSKGASGPSEAYAPKISLSSFRAKIAEAIGTPTPTSIPTATPSPTHTPTPAPTATPEPTAIPDPRQRQLQCQR